MKTLKHLLGTMAFGIACQSTSIHRPPTSRADEVVLGLGEIKQVRNKIYACMRATPTLRLSPQLTVIPLGESQDGIFCQDISLSSRVNLIAMPGWSFAFTNNERILCVNPSNLPSPPSRECFSFHHFKSR